MKTKRELITQRDPKSPVSEVFRTLRTNIQFMNANKKLKTLLITSTFPSEGKSWVASNLAVTFAQADNKVILIDADMRKGRQYTIFGASPRPGLSNYLSGMDVEDGQEPDVTDYLQKTDIENLLIMTAGNIPPNPSELLTSQKMIDLIKYLEQIFDIVIFDGTPSTIVTDAIILSKFVDSTLIVSAHKETKIEDLNQVKRNITNVGGRIAGVVVNKMPTNKKETKTGYYYENSIVTSKKTWGITTKQAPKKKIEEAEINEVKRKLNEVETSTNKESEEKNKDIDINNVLQQLSQYLESDRK